MSYIEITLIILSILMLVPTIASQTRFDQWWIRAFDFPRLQISVITILLIIAWSFFYEQTWHYYLVTTLLLSLIYQGTKIYPYTPLSQKQVKNYNSKKDEELPISLLISNVLTPNNNYNKLIDVVNERKPDILLTLESDKKWEKELEVLEKDYKYTVKIPQDNLYGMHLYSKLKLEETEVRYLVQDDIPSIHAYLRLTDEVRIRIHCVHPMPPSPTESPTSTNRDAELLMVGRDLDVEKESVLVFGDLNDVAWSRTTRMFQKISKLLDPRQGRGFFNTFNANHLLLRWPLDHVFHSSDFTVIEIAREKNIGSDHFPMYLKLNHTPRAEFFHEEPESDKEEEAWAEEKIEDAHPREKEV